jgi:hypothetical protein
VARRQAPQGFGADQAFRWRGGEISRLEGLSDAVFAFAVTLLVVLRDPVLGLARPLPVLPALRAGRRLHHDPHRGADVHRAVYVYPMKFLFSILFDQLFGEAPAGAIQDHQVPLLMLVYGAGFIAVQVVFILLYLRAYRLADALELTPYERLATRSEVQGFAINVGIGLVSIAIVEVGGPDAALWSGMTYMLIAPLQMLNGRVMGGRIRQASTASPQP